jgi:hypothetical protein
MSLDPELKKLLASIGVPLSASPLNMDDLPTERPPVPSTMIGLECVGDRDIILAVGDARNESGYDAAGRMTVCITTPNSQLGALLLTPKQVRQLRDFLTSKLEA